MKKQYETSPFVKTHVPCLDQTDCCSSDGRSIRQDGSSFCYVCSTNFKSNQEDTSLETINVKPTTNTFRAESVDTIRNYSSYPISTRGISQEVVDHFNVKMSVDTEGRPEAHYYPFTINGQIAAYKVRKLPKEFSTVGQFKDAELFGQAQCAGGRTLVITEGELDAMAVAQAYLEKYSKFYPVVSLPNGVQSVKSLLTNRDFVRKFDTVVLMFDMDEAGQEAVSNAAKIIGIGRVKVAKLKTKDPCDELNEHGYESILRAIWDATTWSPAGVLMGTTIWDKYIERCNVESVPYPECLSGLNDKIEGIRQGEITLFTSGTGSGKSTVIKEIIFELLEKTDEKIGLISLEESIGDTAEKFIQMQMRRPLHGHPPATEEDQREAFDKVFGDERLVLLDHQGSVSDDSLMDKIEYMALMGCKYLVLDHITIAVSEGNDGLTGNEAVDKLMSDLLKLVKQHNVWLGLISHLRKAMGGKSFEEGALPSIDDIKGSGSIKQISFDIIAFARNLVAEEEYERNTIKLRVLKSRFTGKTGEAGAAVYDTETTRLGKGCTGFDLEM